MSEPSFPTLEDVRHWQAQLDQLVTDENEMKARHALEEARIRNKRTRLNKLIEAAAAFVDAMGEEERDEKETEAEETPSTVAAVQPNDSNDKPKPDRTQAATRRTGNQTWTATIQRIVHDAGHGLTYQALREELLKTHLGAVLQRTDKAFYGGIGKLETQGRIVKHNGRVYSPSAYKRFMVEVAAGRVEDLPYLSSNSLQASPNEEAVKRLLKEHPQGLTTSEIVENLLNNPPADLAVTKNRNSVYNLLARERDRGNLIWNGEKYSLPNPDSGPHEETAVN